jgi:hypothetical protein
MTKKTDQSRANANSPLFVFGQDENGKPRGARFNEVKDDIVRAALDMRCWVVQDPFTPAEFAPIGMKLPVGRLYASGRAFIPPIRRDLYDKLFATKGKDAGFSRKGEADAAEDTASVVASSSQSGSPPSPKVTCVSPVTSGLPRSWDSVGVGQMVLVQESPAEGWWEAVIVQREDEVLTLRFRDYPKLPTFVRHISTIALVNPGPTVRAT